MEKETFDTLWTYCTAEKRAIPKDWNKLYNMLNDKTQKPTGGWIPSLPLILAAWHCTTPLDKHLRFKEHVQWACDHGQVDEVACYLRALPEDGWYHFVEF